MTYATISTDRREAYYARAAAFIARDPLGHYTRAEAGRKVQAAIKPKDLTLARLLAMGKKAGKVVNFRLRVREARR